MNLLRDYLVQGRSVREIAAERGTDEPMVRAGLARLGLRVDRGNVRDPVCANVAVLGFGSFAAFARKHGTDTLYDQAALLGVSSAALERVYDIFRKFAVEEAKADDEHDPQLA